MQLQKIMPNINKYLDTTKPYIDPSENAHQGLIVPEIVMKYGSIMSKFRSMPAISKYMIGSLKAMKKSYAEMYQQPRQGKTTIEQEDLIDLKVLCDSLGLDTIGFTEVRRDYIFKGKKIIYPNAIVLVTKMNPEIISTAPSKNAEKEIFRSYQQLCEAANTIKHYLNDRGYNAVAGPSLGGEVNYPMLAEDAKLGSVGKHGLLITENLGPSLRLGAVYTDIGNLPFTQGHDYMWIKDFCKACGRCVQSCPANAIYPEPKKFKDGSLQVIDYKKCAIPFSRQNACTVCVKSCAFFKGSYQKIRNAWLKV